MKFNLKDCSGCIYTRNPTHHPSLRVDLRQQASQIGDHVALMICHSFSLAATMGSNPQAPHLLPSKSIRQKLPLAYIAKGKSRVSGDVNIRECGVQGCARRMQWDSDLPDIQACTTPLQGLISHPVIRLENERAMWVCVGLSADNNLIIDPTNMISLDPKILSLLADGTVNALRITFVQAFLVKTTAVISRDILSVLRTVIQYHPDNCHDWRILER